MNLKSDILKLSIIFMLILVLIPVASAMDSNDTFFEEYDSADYEEVIVEYNDFEVEADVEDTQVEVSLDEGSGFEDSQYESVDHENQAIEEENKDAVVVTEYNKYLQM